MMLQGKARQDIKAIDLMASPTDSSPAGDSENGSGASVPAQPAHSQPGFLSPRTSPSGNPEEAYPEESPCAHSRFLPWLSEKGIPWAQVKGSLGQIQLLLTSSRKKLFSTMHFRGQFLNTRWVGALTRGGRGKGSPKELRPIGRRE